MLRLSIHVSLTVHVVGMTITAEKSYPLRPLQQRIAPVNRASGVRASRRFEGQYLEFKYDLAVKNLHTEEKSGA